MSEQIKQVRGGGLHYMAEFNSPEATIFRAGLKHDPRKMSNLVTGTTTRVRDAHDKISYERGYVMHSRSSFNQFANFHFMYGGFRKYIIERRFINHLYRRIGRKFLLPCLFAYSLGCYGMRKYDNAVYNFFYFTD